MDYDSSFDPLDPSTWSKDKRITEEEAAEIDEKIKEIAEKYKESHQSRQLLHYLKFGKADLSFHRRLRKDKDFKLFVNWLLSSEPRTERAIQELDYYVNTVRCPNCHGEFRRGEEREISTFEKFDWGLFAERERM